MLSIISWKYLSISIIFIVIYFMALYLTSLIPNSYKILKKILNKINNIGQQHLPVWSRLTPSQWSQTGGMAGLLLGGIILCFNNNYLAFFLGTVTMSVLGATLPRYFFYLKSQYTLNNKQKQLRTSLEVIANALRAGLSLSQALVLVARETPQPLGEDFSKVVKNIRLGLSPIEALEKLLRSWPNPDLKLFVVAASICLRTGGNLAQVVDRIINTIHARVRLQGKLKTLTSQGKLSGWIVGLLPLGLLLILFWLDPPLIIDFVKHPLGIVMLIVALVMELLGILFIWKIVKFEE